ncbi:MAG: zinc-ribbon domain-containing protein, partial [Candidatus Heimdallarchaeota archaeon]
MTFCPSCGASIETKDTYCPFCGAPTITEKKEEKSVDDFPAEPAKPIDHMQPIAAPGATIAPVTSYPATATQHSQTAPQLEIRSFWMWFLLGFVTFGIASFVYLYYNVQDLNNLARHPAPAGVKSSHIDTSNLTLFIIIGLFTGLLSLLLLIGTYLKFQKLHEYINSHPQRQQTVP